MTSAQPKKKAPKLSEQAKHILRNQRRQLAQQQAAAASRAAIEARTLLGREYQPLGFGAPVVREYTTYTDTALAYHRGVVPRVAAVLASEGVQAQVNYRLDSDVDKAAWTDFSSINVHFPVTEDADPYEVSCILRGLGYHEGGHIRFTVRMQNLFEAYINDRAIPQTRRDQVNELWTKQRNLRHYAWNVAGDQRMENLVVEDSPRKAKYFAPMVIDMVIDYQRTQQDPALAKEAWNDLMKELQRMGVIDQPLPFDQRAVDQQRVASYPLVAWRRYLPKDLRRKMRATFVDVWGLDMAKHIELCILTYIRAKDARTMVDAVVELAPLLRQVMVPPQTDHQQLVNKSWYRDGESRKQPSPGASMDDSDGELDGDPSEGEGEGQGDDSEDGNEAQAKPGKGEQPDNGTSNGNGGDTSKGEKFQAKPTEGEFDGGEQAPTDGHEEQIVQGGKGQGHSTATHDVDKYDEVRKALEDAKAEADEAVRNDTAVQQDVASFNQAFYQDTTGSRLLPYTTRPNEDETCVAQGMAMAAQMVQAFQEVNTEKLPSWQEGQTRGVLNVGRYVTRQPGDREFFRAWADEDQPGRDVAVSVLLDYSGSMGGSENALAAVAYAMKSACDELDSRCTVALWAHQATLLWSGTERAPFVPVIVPNGGTDPGMVLEDVVNHRYDRAKHIILIMTDGGFNSRDNWLNAHRTEGSYFLGAIYNPGQANGGKAVEESMARMGFDRYAAIGELDPLVRMLEQAVIDVSEMPV